MIGRAISHIAKPWRAAAAVFFATALLGFAATPAAGASPTSAGGTQANWVCNHDGYSNGDSFVRLEDTSTSEWVRVGWNNPTTVEPTYRISWTASSGFNHDVVAGATLLRDGNTGREYHFEPTYFPFIVDINALDGSPPPAGWEVYLVVATVGANCAGIDGLT